MDEDIKLPEPVAWIAEYGGDIYTADQLRAAVEADRVRRASLPAGYQVHRLTLGEHQVLREAVADSAEVVAYGRLGEPEQPARKPLTDQEIDEMLDAPGNFAYVLADKRGRAHLFARAIEQAATAPLLARIAELEAKLAEAQKDAARLDYVATGKVTVSRDNGGFQLAWYDHNSQKLKWQNSWHETARAAIDAAMKEEGHG